MTSLKLFITIFFIVITTFSYSQDIEELKKKKQLTTVFTETPPKIDGSLLDKEWEKAGIANHSIQMKPYNDRLAANQTEFRVLYDNTALYIAVQLHDSAPDSIITQLTQRDDSGQADFMAIILDPYNTGLSAFGFFVTAAGVQLDIKFSNNGEDESWDAVWESAVEINEQGWAAEFKIPYSAIRFPKEDIQKPWGINLFRDHKRTREESTWNFIDVTKDGWINQNGELLGLKNIKPPLRLSFTPYFSSYLNKNSDVDGASYSFKGGMDLKYGINESYTLDMMLIPDFGQVQSDDEILNLSPFETYYSEKRGFFTEGMELFSKAGIFHSRRIGGSPSGYATLNEHEVFEENPENAQLINATKVTGTNSNGLSIGALNAMTISTYADIYDTISGKKRREIVQPFTNYNVMAFSKALENNSYASFINTSLMRFDDNYVANVSGFETQLKNKKQTYALSAKGAMSNIKSNDDEPILGYYYELEFGKISGKYQFEFEHRVESDKYNPNDMGFLRNSNEVSYEIDFAYHQNEPTKRLLSWSSSFSANYSTLFYPRNYTWFDMSYHYFAQLKNHFGFGFFAHVSPFEEHDYFEARVEDKMFVVVPGGFANFFISTNYTKKLALDLGTYISVNADDKRSIGVNFSPRWRINDKWNIRLQSNFSTTEKSVGFVDYTDDETSIFFGERDLKSVTNNLDLAFTPTNKMGLSFRLRHYWSTVEYNSFSTLNADGYLEDYNNYTENEDISFNAFTIDFVYKWNFAPGSELNIVWKNAVYNSDDVIIDNYFENTSDLLRNSPTNNSISFKILYYLDYLYLKRK